MPPLRATSLARETPPLTTALSMRMLQTPLTPGTSTPLTGPQLLLTGTLTVAWSALSTTAMLWLSEATTILRLPCVSRWATGLDVPARPLLQTPPPRELASGQVVQPTGPKLPLPCMSRN